MIPAVLESEGERGGERGRYLGKHFESLIKRGAVCKVFTVSSEGSSNTRAVWTNQTYWSREQRRGLLNAIISIDLELSLGSAAGSG